MKSITAIDLGSRNVHIAAGINHKGVLKISEGGCFPLPEGAVKGDRIQNADAIAQIIAESFKSLGIKGNKAVITINAAGAIKKDILIPAESKKKKLESMITNELRLNYNIQDYYVTQFKAIEKEDGENNAMLSAFRTVSIDESLVGICREILVKAKLKPVAMDVNLNALDKLLSDDVSINERPIKEGATALIDFGHHETTVYIHSSGKPLFFRHISFGAGEIERILAEETFADIEDMRENKEGGFHLFDEEEKSQRYFQMLRPFFYSLNDELRNVIKFYNNRYKLVPVDRAYLFGEGSRLNGLAAYWESSLNVPTELLSSISGVSLPGAHIEPLGYINCFGALIRY
ncbi:hypothetical protein MASR2M70_15820 [Bacillota bacterium]